MFFATPLPPLSLYSHAVEEEEKYHHGTLYCRLLNAKLEFAKFAFINRQCGLSIFNKIIHGTRYTSLFLVDIANQSNGKEKKLIVAMGFFWISSRPIYGR